MAAILVVSPHLDDAVLSFGGRITELSEAGNDVLVYTVFAGTPVPPYSPVAEGFHELWNVTGDPVAPRRREDELATKIVGATPLHGGFLDSIYRRDEDGDWLLDDCQPDEFRGGAETPLSADIAAVIGRLIAEHRPEYAYTCAALGDHIDHRRARDAAAGAIMRAGVPLSLWADVPYANWSGAIPELPDGLTLGAPAPQFVGPAAWETKKHAVGCYASQLEMLRDEGRDIFAQLERAMAVQRAEYDVAGTGRFEIVWPVETGA